jgi:hypothetical protein
MLTPSKGWTERTELLIYTYNKHLFENHERIFDYDYGKQVCDLLFRDSKTFYDEMRKHKNIASRIRSIAISKGEDVARPYYEKYRETYERFEDLATIEGYAFGYGSCEKLEELGFFGKR